MSKSFYLIALLLVVIQSGLTADVHGYTPQGNITLIENITNLGYSPDQKHLIVLADTLDNDTFAHYYGYRLNEKQLVKIDDDGTKDVKPSAFAFSKKGDWLVVGTSWGAVYGYPIVQGQIKGRYKYKKQIGTGNPQQGVKSISFSANGQIAVASKDLIVVLTPPADEQDAQFDQKAKFNCSTILTSVAWRHRSESIVIVGGYSQSGFFHIADITKEPIIPVQIETTPSQTLSIGVFPDGSETILQGRLNDNIEVYQWDDTLPVPNYKSVDTIQGTVKATQISITDDGLYFGAEINSLDKVLAWKSGLQLNPANNLKNQALQAIAPDNILTATGKNLALSNDGNRILIIGTTKIADKYRICDDNQWYDNVARDCQICGTGCRSCFNPTECETCPDKTKYINPQNQCVACSSIKNGCQQCSDEKTCTACNTAQHFDPTPDPTDNSCKCAKTYFPENNQCTTCNNGTNFCSECESFSKCTICIEQGHIRRLPENGVCVCEAGWYLDGQCKDCTAQTGCKECQSATNCTLCDQAKNWIEGPSGKCICEPGYWQNGTECTPCGSKTPNCTACQQDGTCTDCIDTRVISPDKTQCICEGHRYEDTTTQKCEFCDPNKKCLHCEPTGDHTCTECDYIDGHRKKQPVDGKCLCQPGYTENAQEVCTQCYIDGCEQCDTLDVCSQCFTEKNFKPDPVDKTCVCIDGYLKKKDKQSCSTCGKQIPGCSQCQELEVCKACNSENHFNPTPNSENKCSCMATYFLNDTLCELCSAEYKNCEECDKTQCRKCQSGYLATDDNKKCLTCGESIPGCKSCTDLKSCIQCNADKQWQLSSDNKTCSCKLGYYKNGTECKFCSMQYPYCTNCSMQSGCFSCQQTFSYNSQKKECFCPDEKQVKDGKCEDKSGLSALAIIAIIVGILAVAGAAVAIIKCFKKRQSPLEDGEYEALEGEKN